MDALVYNLERGGLRISAGADGKSASMRVVVDGKAKKWLVDPTPFLHAGEQVIPSLSVTGEYKYLGIQVSATGNNMKVKEVLDQGLRNLTEAPLKPQQRLYLLNTFLLPKFYHQLVLVSPSDKLLRWLDVCIRSAVRKWLRLPRDTPNAYFHANDQDGGLRIQSLQYSVPLMRKQRLEKLVTSQDPAVIAMRGTERHMKILRRSGKIPVIGQASATSKVAQRIAWRNLLISSVDGRGLASHPEVPRIHNWVTSGSALMTGKEFIGCVQIRGNTMSTAMRRSRGVRPDRQIVTAVEDRKRWVTLCKCVHLHGVLESHGMTIYVTSSPLALSLKVMLEQSLSYQLKVLWRSGVIL